MTHYCNESSLFQLIDRKKFDALVEKHGMDKGVRSLFTWEFTCALITCMTLRLGSFRDIEETLGIPHSTFGDAMEKRFSGFFQVLRCMPNDICSCTFSGIDASAPSVAMVE